jgi:hypothetical protein
MHYVVISTLRLPAGNVVGLNEAQAARRVHAIEPVDKRKGWYLATHDLCFKVGEAIQYEGELPKVLASAVEAPKRDAGKAEPEAKAGDHAGKGGKGGRA